jgi:hypothetical protein
MINNMKAPAIEALSTSHLLPPLRQLFGTEAVDDVEWHVAEINRGAVNPVTMGLYHVYGRVRVGDQTRDFSLILKTIQSPANIGLPHLGGGDDQTHWNHWQREPSFYQSDLVGQLPEGIATPRCYGIQQWDGRIIWLWLEAVEYGRADLRQLDDLGFVAHQLGRLNGKFTHPAHLPQTDWLTTDTNLQWLEEIKGPANLLFTSDGRPKWEHPVLQSLFPPTDHNPYHQFWQAIDRFTVILQDLPRTWCHGDGNPANFKIRQTGSGSKEMVAMDWAMTGIGVLGQDVAQLIYDSYRFFAAEQWDALIQTLLDRYLDGLREMGWRGEERQVWLGYAITVLVRYGIFLFYFIGLELKDADETFPLTDQHKEAARFLQQVAQFTLAYKE